MTDITTTTTEQWLYVQGRKVAKLRNDGALCDIRRNSNGFLYRPAFAVAISEELLEQLPDSTILQFTNITTHDVYSITVHDFRSRAKPVQFAGYEPQRSCEMALMNHTISGSSKSKKRVNELHHIDVTPVPEYSQSTLFG